ncbi:hypothetical protein CIPAW_03G238200 [Carya illinoinensis]|uniref:H15 domain-containing protein n=1 Tax=Carya illinoinensis TaxID=32201 RepID=A0A8T1R8B6_CARIL|nr:hypothetical protein CIPAW_03G238200 [Carya illinoinensis]
MVKHRTTEQKHPNQQVKTKFWMMKEALSGLKEKSGSKPYTIAKYMKERHKALLLAYYQKILGLQLKNLAARHCT